MVECARNTSPLNTVRQWKITVLGTFVEIQFTVLSTLVGLTDMVFLHCTVRY
eukprot:m.1667630 g.1667630  ORF g.1667630 m.1667630 type:complete len:52 (+) comp149192_c0_seq1:37-192(+)